MKRALTLALAALLLLSLLAACGGGSGGGSNKYEGTYYLSKLGDWTVQEYADLLGIGVEEAEKSFMLEVKSGGKASFIEDGESDDCTWKVDGEKFTLSADGERLEGTINGNVISFNLEGEVLELAKK